MSQHKAARPPASAYAGLAASASGFALDNQILVICGALDGGSGLILAMIMSKAMNRSFRNVLSGGVGAAASGAAASRDAKPSREASIEDAAELLQIASSVIVVPGYGMAVAQAQHAVRDLASALSANGAQVQLSKAPTTEPQMSRSCSRPRRCSATRSSRR